MTIPRQIQDVIDVLQKLPGIGPKSAARLGFYLFQVPERELELMGNAFLNLKKGIQLCKNCKNISALEICEICADENRDQTVICVVESPLDVFTMEKMGIFHGRYNVLHGVIDPLRNIGPEELFIDNLIERIGNSEQGTVKEVILALNPTMEGEATAMYLNKKLKTQNSKLKITRLGVGLPIGGDLQYADDTTLTRAIEGRREY